MSLASASGRNPKAYVVRLQERYGLFEVLELEVAAAAWSCWIFSMGGFPVSALEMCGCISKSSNGVLLL